MNFDIKFDFQRRERLGLIEAIWGQDKSIDQLRRLSEIVLSKKEVVFITRINSEKANYLLDLYSNSRFYEEAKCLIIGENLNKLTTNKKVAIIGDISHSRVALSNIYALKKLGAKVMVCGPTTLIPKYIKDLGIEVENNIKNALKWCDVANVLRIQLERQNAKYFPSLREYSLYFGINKKLLDEINKDIIIMHPGPINRGIEINSDVADSRNSIILDQVQNGVAIRMAVMYLLSLNKN